MTPNLSYSRFFKGDLLIAFYFSLINLILHLVLNVEGGYGLFRDEFYYVACARNLSAGYVDHPPLCAFLLRGVIFLLGDSIFAIRLIPAVAGGLTVFVTGLITLRLGGATFSGIHFVSSIVLRD